MSAYVTVDELRDEGVAADISDAQLLRIIQRASALIDAWTHRWFYPKQLTMLLDGTGKDTLLVGPPIIYVTQVRMLYRYSNVLVPTEDELVDLNWLRIYNRHMQGLTWPDDRDNPKISFLASWAEDAPRRMIELFPSGWWPNGVQNCEISGWFGYTDLDQVRVHPACREGFASPSQPRRSHGARSVESGHKPTNT
jgi:hypothetical protein